jgi:crotonobetainyl-CoA:carnitine CoA-transferase CaiB-like acyl-CoA transferase
MPTPLSQVRVVECAGWSGAYAGQLLAHAGADVVRVVPSSGDPLAAEPPFFGASGVSIQETWYNLGKRVVTLDPESVAGKDDLARMLAGADVLLEDWAPGAEPVGVPAHVVRVSATHSGRGAPQRLANDLVANALSGSASVTGNSHTPPITGYGNQSYHTAGLYAAILALAGLRRARITGTGTHIDLSCHEALVSCTEQVLMQWFFDGNWPKVAQRQGGLHWSGLYTVSADAKGDGMMWTLALRLFEEVFPMMAADGHGLEFLDPEQYPDLLAIVRKAPYVMEQTRAWVATKDATELTFEAQRRHLSWGASWDIPTVAASPQIAGRGYFHPREIPGAGTHQLPLGLFRTDAGADPLPAARRVEVRDIGWDARRTRAGGGGAPSPARPLEGVRIFDFTHVLAGPFGTRVLADLGAEVLKVGTAARGGGANSPTHPYYLSWNRNKKSINLNLADRRGIEVARKIAAASDAVIENFSAGVLARWGLDRAGLKDVNPRVTVVSMGGMGQTGPWKSFVTFAPTIHAMTGLTYLTNPAGEHLNGYGFSLTDHLSGLAGALAVLEGVEHARQTGQGLDVDLSQYELGLGLMAPALIDHLANGTRPEPVGNRHPFNAWAPHGIYPCAGEDRWIALAAKDDAQFRALCAVLDLAGLPGDARFATAGPRSANQGALDLIIAAAARDRDGVALADALQTAGVPAGVVQNAFDLTTSDPVLAARGFFGEAAANGTTAGHRIDRFPALFDGARPGPYVAASPLGSDTFDVLTGVLGMDEGEVAELMAEGVLS